MKLVRKILVAMLLGIMAIQVVWAETQEERLRMEFLKLLGAAEIGNLDNVKLHLSRGADVNGKYDNRGKNRNSIDIGYA